MHQLTPPLGWNTWNTYAEKINEQLIKDSADAMIENGLRDAGYTYVVIDDGWTERKRDSQHRLVVDKEKFPSGMRAVADYVHGKGLKLGVYSCVGNMTCGQYPGSYEHEFIDAASFAEWGIDFLKYDYCFKPASDKGELLYRRMGTALANCGRDIVFSACSWGADNTKTWIKSTGAQAWRSTVDIVDTWDSIKSLAKVQIADQAYNGQGCFNDMDMLVVGMNGRGHVGLQGCNFIQYRTHFSLWALLGSPLMIGCDIRNMSVETKEILLNKEVIEINQDLSYRQPFMVGGCLNSIAGGNDECFIWAKLLDNGDYAIGMFNLTNAATNMYFCMSELGLNRTCGKRLVMKNLWSGKTAETTDYYFTTTVEAYDCVLLRAKVMDE